jgi:hypothetical protein
MTWRRDAAARTRWIEPDADVTHVPTGAATPAETADQAEVVARLYAAIHAMADFDRALVLLLLDGLAYREIAEVVGLTENHVGVALTRARKRLTRSLCLTRMKWGKTKPCRPSRFLYELTGQADKFNEAPPPREAAQPAKKSPPRGRGRG